MSYEELSERQRERYLARLRALTPEQSLASGFAATARARAMMEAGIRSDHPDATPRQVQAEVAKRLAGPEIARRLYGADADALR